MTQTSSPPAPALPTLSASAVRQILKLAARENRPAALFRLAVDGGGCSGFRYRMGLEDAAAPDDLTSQAGDVTLLVDPASLPFLEGAELDYIEEMIGSHFSVKNPNAESGCGCGSSFAPKMPV
jgi:iron-sulfur cluster insertion protein